MVYALQDDVDGNSLTAAWLAN